MKNNIRTIIFALLLGIVCSLILTLANFYMAPFREANAKAEEFMNLFGVLNVPFNAQDDAKTLVGIFDNNIRLTEVEGLEFYEYTPNMTEDVKGIAVFFTGSGLWGPVKGVLALEPDVMTIQGIRFYQQEETPGLGGKIGSVEFQQQFVAKKLVSETDQPGFVVAKPGEATAPNAVDGISGASMTSNRVQVMLDTLAKHIGEAREQYGR